MDYIHPITVHFTTALFVMSVVFEVFGWILKKDALKNAGWWNLLFASLAAITSVITGLYAVATTPHNETIHEMIKIHRMLGYIVLAGIILLFLWRTFVLKKWMNKSWQAYLVVGVLILAVMVVGAYYGGEMVYTHGMGIKPLMGTMSEENHHHSHDELDEAHVHHASEADSVDDHDDTHIETHTEHDHDH